MIRVRAIDSSVWLWVYGVKGLMSCMLKQDEEDDSEGSDADDGEDDDEDEDDDMSEGGSEVFSDSEASDSEDEDAEVQTAPLHKHRQSLCDFSGALQYEIVLYVSCSCC